MFLGQKTIPCNLPARITHPPSPTPLVPTIARARELLATAAPASETAPGNPEADTCPCCGGRMIIIETFAGLIPALPTINANHRDQDRHVVTRIPVLRRRRADFACRRFSTDRDDTRQNPPFRRRSKPSRAAPNLHLDHERGVLLANTTIDRVEARRARPRKPSAPAKTPQSVRLRQPSPRGFHRLPPTDRLRLTRVRAQV